MPFNFQDAIYTPSKYIIIVLVSNTHVAVVLLQNASVQKSAKKHCVINVQFLLVCKIKTMQII